MKNNYENHNESGLGFDPIEWAKGHGATAEGLKGRRPGATIGQIIDFFTPGGMSEKLFASKRLADYLASIGATMVKGSLGLSIVVAGAEGRA